MKSDEPKKEWWEEEEPTEKERALWARFYEAFIVSPQSWTAPDGTLKPSSLADAAMCHYRRRFGRA